MRTSSLPNWAVPSMGHHHGRTNKHGCLFPRIQPVPPEAQCCEGARRVVSSRKQFELRRNVPKASETRVQNRSSVRSRNGSQVDETPQRGVGHVIWSRLVRKGLPITWSSRLPRTMLRDREVLHHQSLDRSQQKTDIQVYPLRTRYSGGSAFASVARTC